MDINTKAGWLFIKTGDAHRAWKRREYSRIKHYADTWPGQAWDAGFKAGLTAAAELVERPRCRDWKSKECGFQIRTQLLGETLNSTYYDENKP